MKAKREDKVLARPGTALTVPVSKLKKVFRVAVATWPNLETLKMSHTGDILFEFRHASLNLLTLDHSSVESSLVLFGCLGANAVLAPEIIDRRID